MSRHPIRHPSRLRHAVALACCCLAAPAWSTTTVDTSLTFASGTQSIWGPGGSAGFGGSAYVLGDNSFGVSYNARASSGTVASTLQSGIQARFDSTVDFAQSSAVQIGFDFFGRNQRGPFGIDLLGGSFVTDLGASISVTGHLNTSILGVPVRWNPTIVDYDYDLDTSAFFDPEPGTRATASDAFTPASVGVSIPSFGVGLGGGAGVDLDVRQTARLDIDGVGGIVHAVHRDTGSVVTQALSLQTAGAGNLSFDLGRAGIWDFHYAGLSVLNSFSTQFSLDIRPFIEYFAGVFCGDPGDPDDNFGCVVEDRLSASLAGINLFSSPELSLNYGPLDTGRAFSIEVLAAPIPEPGTMALMLAGVGGLLMRRRLLVDRQPA